MALLCTAALCTGVMTGCKDEKSSSKAEDDGVTIDMEDMEYGATIRTDRKAYSIPLQYDRRFFDEEALKTLAAYYYSIQTNDAELFRSVQQPLYLDYLIKTVNQNKFTLEEMVQNSHDAMKERFGGEFEYALAYVEECATKDDAYSNIPMILNMIDDAASVAGEAKISDKIETIYEMKVVLYLTEKGSGKQGEVGTQVPGTMLYMYQYDGSWYVVY